MPVTCYAGHRAHGRGRADQRPLRCASAIAALSATAALALWVAPAHAAAPPEVGCGKAEAFARRQRHIPRRDAIRREYESLRDAGLREALEATDLLHCQLDIELVPDPLPDEPSIIGSNTFTVASRQEDLLTFTFRLDDTFDVSSAVINGSTPAILATLSDTTRVAYLDRPYDEDEVFTLTVNYSGIPDQTPGAINFTTQSSMPLVYTLSEPYFAYTWWPVKDGDVAQPGDNSDKFTIDVAITAPSDMVSLSNGMLTGTLPISGGRTQYSWSTDYELATYLVFLSSTNYVSWTQSYATMDGGSMPVEFYIYPLYNQAAYRNAWELLLPMLPTFASLFGEYPFVEERCGIYQFGFGGGMEHQTLSGQGSFSEGLTAHELAHQWFGDAITCKRWNDLWLNEGFATYSEALWREFKPGSSGLPALQANMANRRYTGGGSVFIYDNELDSMSQIFNSNTTYNKAAWVLHMLRHVLGSDAFFDMIALYRSTYDGSAVTTGDFQAVCEEIYGGSLDWFFDQWVYGERAPAYRYGWEPVEAGGRHYVALLIDQVQNSAYQRFTMPLDVHIDGDLHVIWNDADREHFLIPVEAPAAEVLLDRDLWVLWSSLATIPYAVGPPKVVDTIPAPGAAVATAEAGSATLTFHTDVTTVAGDYVVTGEATGPRAFTFAYDAPTFTTQLTFAEPLPPDVYTIFASNLRTTGTTLLLDGEMTDPFSPEALPSGNGLQGGQFAYSFEVVCPGDADCDGDVDLRDAAGLQACYTGEGIRAAVGCGAMRLDGDEDVDLDDAALFAAAMGGPGE